MNKWIQKLFQSLGLKRKVAAFLAALSPVLQADPHLAFLIPYADSLAGFFGIAGVGHAAYARRLTETPAATLSAAFSALLLLTHVVPALAQYAELIRVLAALFGVSLIVTNKTEAERAKELGYPV